MSAANREKRERNRQRREAGDSDAKARVKQVKADDLLAAYVQVHGREKLAAQVGAASTNDEDLALAYAYDTARDHASQYVDRNALIRATYRSALATLQPAPE